MPAGGHNRVDLTGKRFTRLLVKQYFGTKDRRATWLCECVCGADKVVSGKELMNGHTKSCGCAKKDTFYKHGYQKNRFYYTYQGMLKRCYHKNHVAYSRYGGRGIVVCDEWKNDIAKFIAWCESKNPEIGLTLDRYPDNDGPYCPENCRFATRKQQNNMRSNLKMRALCTKL